MNLTQKKEKTKVDNELDHIWSQGLLDYYGADIHQGARTLTATDGLDD